MNHLVTIALWSLATTAALAEAPTGAVQSPADAALTPSFDILAAHIHRDGGTLTFQMTTNGIAGADIPPATGTLAGAAVWSYVWPTTLDPATVGFEGGTGILALAATSHPDFDDTPLYDETADGDAANDGGKWHAHWVVLTPTDACGAGMLGVRDIPEGTKPALPATWPGLPLFIDSPDVLPVFDSASVSLTVPLAAETLTGAGYDGVTAALRVNADMHAPLLCVTDVFDVASGDLSLLGKID
jgi:ABC-type transport system substrate-binding protein